jgi:hypothetical protein
MDERIQRLIYLRDECDHCILSSEFVTECARIFDCKLECYKIDDSLLFEDTADPFGMGADEIVVHVCAAYKIRYANKFGRGSQLWECCARLLEFFASPQAPPLPVNGLQ